MPNVRTNARSFAGGAVSGEFYGRLDHVKYATGLAVCRNFIPLPHGPVVNRAGTRYVNGARHNGKKSRLIPFTYSIAQTVVLELAEGCARFHTQASTLLAPSTAWNSGTAYEVGDAVLRSGVRYYCKVAHANQVPPNAAYWVAMSGLYYELPLPYAEADLAGIRYVQSADVLTLTHENYPPAEIRRYGAQKWVYAPIVFGTTIAAPSLVYATATPAATSPGTPTTQSYVVTAVDKSGGESIASSASTGASFTISSANWPSGEIELSGAVSGQWSTGDFVEVSASANDGTYVVDVITPIGTGLGATTELTLRALGGDRVSLTGSGGGVATRLGVRNNLNDDGAYNTIRWGAVAGADRYYVYKSSNGLYGYVGQTDQTIFTDDNIAADVSKTPPVNSNPFSGAGNYPRAVSYFEQRRTFGGTLNASQNLWLTRPGTESNLNRSVLVRDDDAISFKVAARQINAIQHIVPLQALVLLTNSAVWRVQSVNSDALTPTSISVKPQSFIGANDVQPVLASENLIYVSARGGHLREVSYSWQKTGYVTGDLSRYNPAMFDTFDITDMAVSESPYPIIWCVSTSGDLISVTYVPEESVSGLAKHDTDGVFESVACVAEGDEDFLYCVVRREVNGQSVRYVERMESRLFGEQVNAFFVDAGARYSGAPVTTLNSGLTHLEGETVSILADGAVHPQRVVTGGAITLEEPASVVAVGLPIQADIQTLPIVLEIDGLGQGRAKNVNRVYPRVSESSGIFAGPNFDNLREHKQRTIETYGQPPQLVSDEIEIVLDGEWQEGGQICIRQSDPLPVTIVSVSAEVSIGG
ncbi:hypothetical protein [Asticcacaulis sp.]|uniref:hypothetical protein n=1 Tax=Asticcacaulis sp. TaxID=1872648 RepID=UPI0031E26C32